MPRRPRPPAPVPIALLVAAFASGIPGAGVRAAPAAPPAPSAESTAGEPVRYTLSFPNAVHHEAEVEIAWTGLDREPLEVRMSRASPGRYALHGFAKNVSRVRAGDGSGRPLRVERTGPNGWRVHGHDGRVVLRYTLYGDRADGTYVEIDARHAHLNAPATYLWARGTEDRPVELVLVPPEGSGWSAATQLAPAPGALRFTAPGLAYLMDSPVELGELTESTWDVSSGDRTQTIRLAVLHEGTEAEVTAYARLARAVVREQIGIFGELPRFDRGEYLFIGCYLPEARGDGMEHRNSTVLTSPRPLGGHMVRNLATLSHEFVHAWNVERLRPRSLEPFGFERANPCPELWFAEGFTTYYTNLVLVRAGIISLDEYGNRIAHTAGRVLRSPARRRVSAAGASRIAPLFDGARWTDPVDRDHVFLSYYAWGSVIGLGLDLTLRSRFPGVDLDGYMRLLWRRFGRPETPYTSEDLEAALAELTGDEKFARGFFDRHVRGSDVVDLQPLLERAGLLLRSGSEEAWWGDVALREAPAGVRLNGVPHEGTPLREAGIGDDDLLTRLGDRRVRKPEDVESALAGYRPGEELEVRLQRYGEARRVVVELAEEPRTEVVPFERAGRELDEATRSFREDWLGSRAPGPHDLPERVCPACARRYTEPLRHCPQEGERLEIATE